MQNKWRSKTTGLESKEQLKSYRQDKWRGSLLQNNLNLALYPWWTVEEKALEQNLFAEADEDYEARKLTLKAELEKLAPQELTVYFDEIKTIKSTVAEYLSPSVSGRAIK